MFTYYDSFIAEESSRREPNFNTECFFMTIHAFHISLLPCCRKCLRRGRILRDMSRMLDELRAQESTWKNLPIAERNKAVIKKWSDQIKVRYSVYYIHCLVTFLLFM